MLGKGSSSTFDVFTMARTCSKDVALFIAGCHDAPSGDSSTVRVYTIPLAGAAPRCHQATADLAAKSAFRRHAHRMRVGDW